MRVTEKSAVRSDTARPSARLRELDGLRGIAILLVILCHGAGHAGMGDAWIHREMSPTLFVLWHAFEPGWIGVDLFFVLSGYLITGILLDTSSRAHYYRNFFVRRALRILPLYYGFLLACLALPAHVPTVWLPWFAAYVGNFRMASHAFPLAIGPLWSLQVEEQFYLTYPWIVRKAGRRTLTRVLLLAIVSAFAFRLMLRMVWPANGGATYFLMPSRMDALAMGGLVAIAFREWPQVLHHRAIPALTVICAVGFMAAMWLNGRETIGYTLIDLTFTGVLIILISGRSRRLTAVCRMKALVGLGTISYCLYLIHTPILMAVVHLSRPLLMAPGGDVAVMAIGLMAGIGAAALSWRYFEAPILALKDRLAPPLRSAAQAASTEG